MKFHPKYLFLLLLIPAMMACNFSSLVAGTQAPVTAQQNTPRQTPGQAGAPLSELENSARQTVSDFLTAMQSDPAGKKAEAFLSPALLKTVSGGKSIDQVLNVQSNVPKFQVSAVTFSPDANQASVDVSLLFQAPVNRRIVLVRSGSSWKIDSVLSLEGEAGYPPTPELVVESFLSAYQVAPDQMNKYLSSMRLQQLPPGGAVNMLNITGSLAGSMVQSAAVNPDNPPSAAITVNIRVGDKDVTRLFTLSKENNQWKIDNIDPAK
jgi:hypothetical protein